MGYATFWLQKMSKEKWVQFSEHAVNEIWAEHAGDSPHQAGLYK